MEIRPGIGIGPIKYGISEDELISVMGIPDLIEEDDKELNKEYWSRHLWYSSRNIYFTFSKEDNFRLGVITIMGSGYPLLGKELFGLSIELVKKHITATTNEIAKYEEAVDEQSLIHDSLGIIFWFNSCGLSEMQCGYLFETDNETVIWP